MQQLLEKLFIGRYIRGLSLLTLCRMYDFNVQHRLQLQAFYTLPNHVRENIEIFCVLLCQRSSNKLAMNSIWIDNSYFREEIRVSLYEAYYFYGKRERQKFAYC